MAVETFLLNLTALTLLLLFPFGKTPGTVYVIRVYSRYVQGDQLA